jgi:hypothetical protein
MNSPDEDKIRFVRVQDDLYGMHVDSNGDLILHRDDRKYNRNTTHFAVNGVVGNHAEGTFDGAITIVADPGQMDVPSGLRQEDVWFHNDARGNLNVDKATVLAPFGTDLPQGVNSVFYDPSADGGRNGAVNRYLETQGVNPQIIGSMGWVNNGGLNAYDEWQTSTAIELYGENAAHIQFCSHANSVDDSLDSSMNACEGLVKASKDQYISDIIKPGELYTDVIDSKISATYEAVEKFKKVSSPSVVATASGYLDKIERKLEECKIENEKTKQYFSSPWRLRGNNPGTDGEALSETQIVDAIKAGGVSQSCEVFDVRYPENNWRPLSELFPEVLSNRIQMEMPPPLPSATNGFHVMPPPLPDNVLPPPLTSVSEMRPPPLPGSGTLINTYSPSAPVGSAPPPPPFYLQTGEAANKATEALGARFGSLVTDQEPSLESKRHLKM